MSFLSFSSDDDVYMEDTSLLDEYILNDQGAVFKGSYDKLFGKAWNFGQVSVWIGCLMSHSTIFQLYM